MSDMVTVGISDMKIVKFPDVLVTYALGSCVGVCLYDVDRKIGGLGHVMLPNRPEGSENVNLFRFADTCVPLMLKEMEKMGCRRSRIQAKIAGGAKMFQVSGDTAFGNIGQRNTLEVKKALAANGIRIIAEDTGLDYGRTLYFHTENGSMVVKSFAKGTKAL